MAWRFPAGTIRIANFIVSIGLLIQILSIHWRRMVSLVWGRPWRRINSRPDRKSIASETIVSISAWESERQSSSSSLASSSCLFCFSSFNRWSLKSRLVAVMLSSRLLIAFSIFLSLVWLRLCASANSFSSAPICVLTAWASFLRPPSSKYSL